MQGHSLDELAFRSQSGVIGSWIGFLFNVLILIAQFWVGAWPVDYEKNTPAQQVNHFFLAYLAFPIIILFYSGYKLWFRTPFMRCRNMDLKTGMRELNLRELLAEEKAEAAAWPKWKKAYKVVC